MDRQRALHVFERFGQKVHGDDQARLRSAWIMLAKQFHRRVADDCSNERAMAEINAAHDVLKHEMASARERQASAADPRRHGICVWAWAGHPGDGAPLPNDRIEVPDERDFNFVRRRAWQLSGGSTEEWTLWGFDGHRFLAPHTVYGSRQIFPELARMALIALRIGFRRPRGIFVQKFGEAWSELLLLHADGAAFPATPFKHNGRSAPTEDPAFVDRLPAMLSELHRSQSGAR